MLPVRTALTSARPEVKVIESRGYDVFGYPDFGFNYVAYNFADTTGDFNNIIAQLYIRQALAHLEDEQGYIKAFFGGAAGPAYGPIPAVPKNPFTPADAVTDPYPFSVADAISLLKSHGWTVTTSGTDTCAKAGAGPGDCGAGIPAGTKLAFNLIYVSSYTVIGDVVTALASKAASGKDSNASSRSPTTGGWMSFTPVAWIRTWWAAHRTRNSSLRVDSSPIRSESRRS